MTSSLAQALHELIKQSAAGSMEIRLPSDEEVSEMEERLGHTFHPDYRRFLLEASNADVGLLEPAMIGAPGHFRDLEKVAKDGWDWARVPRGWLPFCEDNGDYYCIADDGRVHFWSHDGKPAEAWPSLAEWILDVWVGGN